MKETSTIIIATPEEIDADAVKRRAQKEAAIFAPGPKCPCGKPQPTVKENKSNGTGN
jgi:hypothetical protein